MADINEMRNKFFQGRKDDIERNARTAQQEQSDAITRRFTSMGQAGSGAAVAAQIKARDAADAQANAARNELGGQELQSQFQAEQLAEPQRQRDFASAQAEKDMAFKKGLFDVEQGNKLKELDLAQKQFDLDAETTGFNRRMAEAEANKAPKGLFGQGGLLGTGLNLSNPFSTESLATAANPVVSVTNKILGGGK